MENFRERDKSLNTSRPTWLAASGIVFFFVGILALWVAESINTLTYWFGVILVLYSLSLLVIKIFYRGAKWLDEKLS